MENHTTGFSGSVVGIFLESPLLPFYSANAPQAKKAHPGTRKRVSHKGDVHTVLDCYTAFGIPLVTLLEKYHQGFSRISTFHFGLNASHSFSIEIYTFA